MINKGFYSFTATIIDMTVRNEKDIIQTKLKDVEIEQRAKDLFYAAVSHEFRTPLNSIIATSELLMLEDSLSDICRFDDFTVDVKIMVA